MPIFRVSQSELWHRIYTIKADTLEAAKEKYAYYVETYTEDEDIFEDEPEYIDDIKEDVVWFEVDDKGLETNIHYPEDKV